MLVLKVQGSVHSFSHSFSGSYFGRQCVSGTGFDNYFYPWCICVCFHPVLASASAFFFFIYIVLPLTLVPETQISQMEEKTNKPRKSWNPSSSASVCRAQTDKLHKWSRFNRLLKSQSENQIVIKWQYAGKKLDMKSVLSHESDLWVNNKKED